jgi:CRP-like cAMP-binding protein
METPFLDRLGPQLQAAFLAASTGRAYDEGQEVYRAGDRADFLLLLGRGRVAMRVVSPGGRRATVQVHGPGSLVGELALVRRDPEARRPMTMLALEPVRCRVLTRDAFEQLCARHPAVRDTVMELVADRNIRLGRLLLEAMYDPLDRRVVARLLELVDTYPPATQGDPPVIRLTQGQIADLVGGTRPSVNQVLQRLQHDGLLELGRGRVTVLRPADLRARLDAG